MLALSDYDYLESLEAFQKGWIQVQDISSALVGELAAPKKDSYVMDVCAAPGGKSLHIADKLQGTAVWKQGILHTRRWLLLKKMPAVWGQSM